MSAWIHVWGADYKNSSPGLSPLSAQGYGENPQQKWPLILFLHGAGERGDDLNLVKVHGIPKIVEQREDFPFIVASPQCPKNSWWPAEADALNALLHLRPSVAAAIRRKHVFSKTLLCGYSTALRTRPFLSKLPKRWLMHWKNVAVMFNLPYILRQVTIPGRRHIITQNCTNGFSSIRKAGSRLLFWSRKNAFLYIQRLSWLC